MAPRKQDDNKEFFKKGSTLTNRVEKLGHKTRNQIGK